MILLANLAHAAGGADGGHHGMDWGLVGLQASNFILFFLLLAVAARRPISDALGNRANAVRRDLDESQAVRASAQRQYAEMEEKLASLERRIEEMKAEAVREAEAEGVRIRERADADAVRIRETAQRTVREEALRARNEIRREVVEQAANLAREMVKNSVNGEDQARLQSEFLGALAAPHGGAA
jgi:F-type H+-transporting ATPase subunit b